MSWWEGLCRRCGRCCYEKLRTSTGVVVREDAPCGFLHTGSRLCRVYGQRFARCPQCRRMTIFHALFASYLPDDCGYVRTFRIWRRSARNRPGG